MLLSRLFLFTPATAILRMFLSIAHADTALTAACVWIDEGVEKVIWMSMWAMSFPCAFSRWRSTSQNIGCMGDGIKMFGPHAGTVPAKVIPFETFRRFASEKLMSLYLAKSPVAILVDATQIDGTAVSATGIDMRPEEFGWSTLSLHRVTSGVMRQAVCAVLPLSIVTDGAR